MKFGYFYVVLEGTTRLNFEGERFRLHIRKNHESGNQNNDLFKSDCNNSVEINFLLYICCYSCSEPETLFLSQTETKTSRASAALHVGRVGEMPRDGPWTTNPFPTSRSLTAAVPREASL